jgi:hypothetical protein
LRTFRKFFICLTAGTENAEKELFWIAGGFTIQ